jgi:phage terminase large subunit-like protein
MARDDDLKYYSGSAREYTIKVRDLLDEFKEDETNPRWVLGLLFGELHARGYLGDEQHDRLRHEVGL